MTECKALNQSLSFQGAFPIMELIIHQQERSWKTLTTSAISLTISPDFQEHEPQYFGAPPARSETYKSSSFTGNTRQGGSCNVREIHIIPHCHGTHTEDIGHICHESPGVLNTLQDSLFLMVLLSLPPVPAASCGGRAVAFGFVLAPAS